jgi:hypothetical protein
MAVWQLGFSEIHRVNVPEAMRAIFPPIIPVDNDNWQRNRRGYICVITTDADVRYAER